MVANHTGCFKLILYPKRFALGISLCKAKPEPLIATCPCKTGNVTDNAASDALSLHTFVCHKKSDKYCFFIRIVKHNIHHGNKPVCLKKSDIIFIFRHCMGRQNPAYPHGYSHMSHRATNNHKTSVAGTKLIDSLNIFVRQTSYYTIPDEAKCSFKYGIM